MYYVLSGKQLIKLLDEKMFILSASKNKTISVILNLSDFENNI